MERFKGRLGAVLGEIAQKRIAGSEREKTKLNVLNGAILREYAVDNLVRCAVPAHSQKLAIALKVRFSSELGRVAGSSGSNHVNAQPKFAQSGQFSASELCRTPATSRGIYDGDKLRVHEDSVGEILPCFNRKRWLARSE